MAGTDAQQSEDHSPPRIRLPSPGCLLVVSLAVILGSASFVIAWPVYRQQSRLEYFRQLHARVDTVPAGSRWLRGLVARHWGEESAAGFSDVTWLVLEGDDVSDASLGYLWGLANLRGLSLANTRVTDAGLEQLRGLERLEVLSLHNTRVGDAGLRRLSGLTSLRELYLSRTDVTDAGLQHLYGLPRLEILWLRQTEVTPAGIEDAQSHLPDCEIKVSSSSRVSGVSM